MMMIIIMMFKEVGSIIPYQNSKNKSSYHQY